MIDMAKLDEDLPEKEEEIKELKYELVDSIVNIFNEIEDLRYLGVAADNEYYKHQLVKFGLHIIKYTGDFEHYFRIWHGLAKADRAWKDFRMNFEAAHIILETIRDKILQYSSFHQANVLAEWVGTETQSIQSSILKGLDNQNQENEPSTQEANSVQFNVQAQMMECSRPCRVK